MWKYLLGGAAALFVIGCGLPASAAAPAAGGIQGGICSTDDEIAAGERKTVGDAALALVRAMMANDDGAAYAMMTGETQAHMPRAEFAQFITTSNAVPGPFRDPQVSHVFVLETTGTGADGRGICSAKPDGMISVEVKPGQRQAHVLITAQTVNNSWAFTIWLLPDGTAWRVQYVHIAASAIVGKSVDDMLQLARRERDAGRTFNAAMLYLGAQGLADRGPAFQLKIAQTLNDDMQAMTPPPELQGKAPYTWTMNGKAYSVAQAGIIGIDKGIGLIFVLPHQSWGSDAAIDAQNREFLDAFRAAHPDFVKVFAFLTARAMKPDNSGGFGTVYDVGKGYD